RAQGRAMQGGGTGVRLQQQAAGVASRRGGGPPHDGGAYTDDDSDLDRYGVSSVSGDGGAARPGPREQEGRGGRLHGAESGQQASMQDEGVDAYSDDGSLHLGSDPALL